MVGDTQNASLDECPLDPEPKVIGVHGEGIAIPGKLAEHLQEKGVKGHDLGPLVVIGATLPIDEGNGLVGKVDMLKAQVDAVPDPGPLKQSKGDGQQLVPLCGKKNLVLLVRGQGPPGGTGGDLVGDFLPGVFGHQLPLHPPRPNGGELGSVCVSADPLS